MSHEFLIRGKSLFTLKSLAEGKPAFTPEIQQWIDDGFDRQTGELLGVTEATFRRFDSDIKVEWTTEDRRR